MLLNKLLNVLFIQPTYTVTFLSVYISLFLARRVIEADTKFNRGECSSFLQSLTNCWYTRSWHAPFFCVISDLITTRQFNWTNISKDEKVNINYVIFSFIFFLESPLFINNAMIKLHDTQVVVTWRTLPGHVDYGLIIWSLLGHLSDCFITWRVSLM